MQFQPSDTLTTVSADELSAEESVKRTHEIEEATNRLLIHPMSRALVTRFARWGVSPNAVSLTGLAFGAGAAWAYFHYAQWPFVLLGFALMAAWHVMDGADGQLARLTGKTSEIGKILDGACDHGTFVLVYVSLATAAASVHGAWVWALAVAAGASHAVQASVYEAQRHAYDVWVHGKTSSRLPSIASARRDRDAMHGVSRILGHLNLLYVRVQHAVGAGSHLREHLETLSSNERGAAERIAATYRRANLAGVRRWNLLCSNYRTVAIAVACLLGNPVIFFAFEVVVLNAVFAGLLIRQRATNQALLAELSESSDTAI